MPQSSLQKRFAIVALVILLGLGAILSYSQNLVDKTAEDAIQSVAEIREIERQVNDIRSSFQKLEQLVYQRAAISYNRDRTVENRLQEQVGRVDEQIKIFFSTSMKHNKWQEETKNDPQSFSALAASLKQHYYKVKRYIRYYNLIVSDIRLRFPATATLNESLLPLNREFVTAINNALNEVDSLPLNEQSAEIKELLVELRYAWTQQVSIFRMFVLSRSGMFDTPRNAMQATIRDRQVFVERVDDVLAKLSEFNKKGVLPFETSLTLEQMQRSYEQYQAHFEKIKPTLMSNEWRIDHLFLRKNLQPEFQSLTATTNRISEEIKARSAGIVESTRTVVSDINSLFWVSGLLLIGLMVVGYLMFEKLIRRPLLGVADAMNAEARGQSFSPIMNTNTREARLLVDAFRNMQEQVHSRQARLESILGNAAEGIITMDKNGIIETFNKAAEELFGYGSGEVVGQNINRLFPEEIKDRQDSFVSRLCKGDIRKTDSEIDTIGLHKKGETFPVSLKITEMTVAGQQLYTAMVDDVSERISMISNLRHLAEHDSLTSLSNRYFFLQELERVVQRAARGLHTDVALLYIDMDNFKYVNDTMGHMAGDKLLIEVAGMLKKRSRETDLVARIGGDEFAILLYDVDQHDAIAVADSFRHKLQNYHFNFEGKIADIGCSIGVAMIEQSVGKDELLARADLSCNAAKRAGRNKIHLYTEHDRQSLENITDDMGWVRRIKDAIRGDRFMFVLQPIMHATTHETSRCEVLLRMLDDEGKFIMPSGFIPPAERFSLMPEIDKWVVNHAVDYLASNESTYKNLSINLSAASFDDDEIISFITDKIAKNNIDPTRLTFEITETMAMADLELAASFLEKLRSLGCRTALDDFGVGYSSFAYLKDLPVDYVKIDGSFVRDIDTNELNKAIVKSMNDVAQAMGKLTVAEFVESEAGLQMLELIGVDFLQGYHIGRPEIPAFEKRRITLSHCVVSFP